MVCLFVVATPPRYLLQSSLLLLLTLLQSVKVVNVAFECLTLNRQRQLIVVALNLLSIDDRPDNLSFELVDDFALSAFNGAIRGDFTVAIDVVLPAIEDVFKIDQTLLGNEDVVVFEEVGNVELTRCLHSDVLQIASCQGKVVIDGFAPSQEAQFVLLERVHYCLQKLSLRVLKLLRVNKDELVFEKLGREHNLERKEPLLGVDWVLE